MKRISKQKILILVILDVLLVATVLLVRFFQSEREERLYSQQAGARWESDDVKCAQVSAFFADSKAMKVENMTSIHNDIMKTLYDDTFIDANEGVTGRAWIDSYCSLQQLSVSREGKEVTANVYGVSDDFFQIHPIPLKSGGYINPVKSTIVESDGEDPFQIVLDENVAWNLFGGNDIEGMKVWMGGRIFTVMGVVEMPQNKTEEMAYGNFDGVYVPYAAFAKMGIENSPITCYEAVMPNPIPNYAYNTLAEALDIEEETDEEMADKRSTLFFGDTEILENTNRFNIPSLYKYIKNKKYMTMRTDAITYPYWENVARFEVERAGRIFILCCILLLLPALTVIGTVIWLYTKRGVVFNSTNKEKLIDLAGEFMEGVKNRIKHPEPENYDDDDVEEEAEEEAEEVQEDSYEEAEEIPEESVEEPQEAETEAETEVLEEEPEEAAEEPQEPEVPAQTVEETTDAAEPADVTTHNSTSAYSRLEEIKNEDESDTTDIAEHQLNINADDDLGIELEIVEN